VIEEVRSSSIYWTHNLSTGVISLSLFPSITMLLAVHNVLWCLWFKVNMIIAINPQGMMYIYVYTWKVTL